MVSGVIHFEIHTASSLRGPRWSEILSHCLQVHVPLLVLADVPLLVRCVVFLVECALDGKTGRLKSPGRIVEHLQEGVDMYLVECITRLMQCLIQPTANHYLVERLSGHVAIDSIVLHCVAARCSVLQRVAACCRVLQGVGMKRYQSNHGILSRTQVLLSQLLGIEEPDFCTLALLSSHLASRQPQVRTFLAWSFFLTSTHVFLASSCFLVYSYQALLILGEWMKLESHCMKIVLCQMPLPHRASALAPTITEHDLQRCVATKRNNLAWRTKRLLEPTARQVVEGLK